MEELGLKTALKTRYMDDVRKTMAAIKRGIVYRNFKLGHCPIKELADQLRY